MRVKKSLTRVLIFTFFIFTSLLAEENVDEKIDKRHILYLMHSNKIEKAFSNYQKLSAAEGNDFDTLQKMCIILLKNGAKSDDEDIERLSIFGAGLAASNASIDILAMGVESTQMQTQLLSLHFLSTLQDDKIDSLLTRAMNSDFLPTRLEAAHHMATRKHPHAIGQIESLMFKLPIFLKPFFPSLFASIGTTESTTYLKKFLNDANPNVRLETILSIANFSLDNLLDYIRNRFANSTTGEKEAISFTMAALKDTSCIKDLKKLASSPIENVSISASRALYILGEEKYKSKIMDLAGQYNLFAIAILAEINGSEDLLYRLTKSKNSQVKINAAISLLKRKDARSLEPIKDILLQKQDYAYEPFFSVGRTIMYFKVVPSAMHRMKKSNYDPGISLKVREHVLKDALELKEEDFLKIARAVLQNNQNDLVPILMTCLENLSSENAISLIKYFSINSRSQLIRDYSHLSLYRLKIEGPHETYISNWIKKQNHRDLIKLNLMNQKKEKNDDSMYSLNTEESTRLLIDMYSALASKMDEKSLSIIIDAIKKTNPKNRYALAGILIRATQ